MTLLPIFIACAFTLVALWFMIAPFLGGSDAHLRLEHLDEDLHEIEALATRRSVLLTSLRELEFDREVNKLTDEDYEKFRRRYEAEGVRIMRRLTELHGGDKWQTRVDDELADKLGRQPVVSPLQEEEVVEAPVATVVEPSDEQNEARSCSDCGTVLAFDDNFCRSCGLATSIAVMSTPATEASA